MRFTKMHGVGNDYVYVDCFSQSVPEPISDLAVKLSHRRFGIGGDGLILIRPSDIADARMQMLNADGTESEMCGNGLRCVAKYVHDHGIARKQSLAIETGAGVLQVEVHPGRNGKVDQVTVNMGKPVLRGPDVPTTIQSAEADGRVVSVPTEFDGQAFDVTCVSMGNPHCVIFVDSATDDLVLGMGPKIENDPRFPNRVNVEFVEVLSPSEVRQRTWERGSGETWACGTGASAVCVAGVLAGRTERRILNHLLGGDLTLQWDADSGSVLMTGPATEVYSGDLDLDQLD